jgi:ABC-type multidrug transport system ATPase subunit
LKNCPLILNEVRKSYNSKTQIKDYFTKQNQNTSKKVAIENLSLGFRKGEIFGLLGPNGAGKTSSISIVTCEVLPDAGCVKINRKPLNITNAKLVNENIGLCPQHNPFWDEITLREHLSFYACLRKLDETIVEQTVDR